MYNEQIEFHAYISACYTEEFEELIIRYNGNRSLWWLINDLQG